MYHFQELIQRAKDVRHDIGQSEKTPEHQTFLEKDLHAAQWKLKESETQLEEINLQQAKWEHEMLILRQNLQNSATKDMKFGISQSVETLHIEAELACVQQKAAKLSAKRAELMQELQKWSSQNGKKILQHPPKTVRMVKRDYSTKKSPSEHQNELIPALLPRGQKNGNSHDFLNSDGDEDEDEKSEDVTVISKCSTLPRSFRSDDLKDLRQNGPVYTNLVKPSMIHGYRRKVRTKIRRSL